MSQSADTEEVGGTEAWRGAGTSHLQNIGLAETMDQSSDGFPGKRAGKCAQTSVRTTLTGYKHEAGERQPPHPPKVMPKHLDRPLVAGCRMS